jgi:hypothetical protein
VGHSLAFSPPAYHCSSLTRHFPETKVDGPRCPPLKLSLDCPY